MSDRMDADPTHASLSVLVNPVAGRGLGRSRGERVAAELTRVGLPFELRYSEYPGHLRELAAEVSGTVVAVGGDGTVHEVVNGLEARDGRLGPLAVLPSGSGNDFASAAGFGESAAHLVSRLRDPTPHSVDVGVVEIEGVDGPSRRRFTNHVGVGFEADVAAAAAPVRWLRGKPLYLLATVRALRRQRSFDCVLTCTRLDGQDQERTKALFCSVCNGGRIGGGLRLAPDAVIDDGLLDVIRVVSRSRRRTLLLLARLLGGTHAGDPRVRTMRCSSATIRAARPVPVTVDGEVFGSPTQCVSVSVAAESVELVGTGSAQPGVRQGVTVAASHLNGS